MICMKISLQLTRPIFISSLKHKEQVRRFNFYNNETDLNSWPHDMTLLTIHKCYKLSMHVFEYEWIATQSGYTVSQQSHVVYLVSFNHEYVFQ